MYISVIPVSMSLTASSYLRIWQISYPLHISVSLLALTHLSTLLATYAAVVKIAMEYFPIFSHRFYLLFLIYLFKVRFLGSLICYIF